MLVDTVIALLRENTPASLAEASALAGIQITKCPPAVPPWPPKPVETRTREKKIARVGSDNPCLPKSDAFQKYRRLRVGMTREELRLRGVHRRDIQTWTKNGSIVWTS